MTVCDDRGSGTLLGLAVIGSLVGVVAICVPLYMSLVVQQSTRGAADASALAAADVAVGIAPGFPCTVATRVATANHTELTSCSTDGAVATVRVERPFLGFVIASSATAGESDPVSN